MTHRILCSFALAAALIVGCDDKDKQPAPKVDNTPKLPTADDVKKGVDNATKTITDTSKNATATATDASKTATDAAKTATDEVKTNASDWMDKLQAAIKENKLDDAKTYIDKLQAIRAQLPDDLKGKFDSLKAAFDAAKAKAGLPK